MLRPLAGISATKRGFALKVAAASEVVVLARPVEEEHAAVLAFLTDGESWSSSALALALGTSQRTVQRALDALAAAGKVQSFGRGASPPLDDAALPGFTTTLLLPRPAGRLGWTHEKIQRRNRPRVWPLRGCRASTASPIDGKHVWFASGDKLNAFDPASGKTQRTIDVAAPCGTAFDGKHLYQIAEDRIHKIDPKTGRVLATIPAPGGGGDSGLAWAEGTLWVGQYRNRKIHQIDPTPEAILRTIESNRFVTGVTWVDGEYGTPPGKATRAI